MRKLSRLSVSLAVILLLIACENVENPGEIEYKVNHWPDVKTLEITDITETSATLNAAVNAFNLPTTVTFEYGNTASYGNAVIANQSPVIGNGITNVSANISGLLPSANYHFRVKAENSVWKNFYGSDKTFVLPVLSSDIHIPTCTNYNSGNSGLPSNIIGPIAIDRSNNIWMASSYMNNDWTGTIGTGVTRFDGANWTTFTTADGLADNEVSAITIDAQGNKWFGTYGGGVSKFDGNNWTTFNNTNGFVCDFVTSIAIDAQGIKWFGTWGGGVSKFDGTGWTTYTTEDGLANNQINSIIIDPDGNKWIGTSNGISKFDGQTWTNYNLSSNPQLNMITSIAIDAQGSKWFGLAFGGIRKFDSTNWITFTWANNSWYPHVYATVIDAQDNKWFGTGDGVAKFDGKKWTVYTNANGVEIGVVVSIAIDSEGNKWLGTYGGGILKLSCEFK